MEILSPACWNMGPVCLVWTEIPETEKRQRVQHQHATVGETKRDTMKPSIYLVQAW